MPYRIPTNTFLPIDIADATTSSAGVMTAEDKRRLDQIAPGDGALEIRVIYVRAFGNDVTGDGSLANPYRTVAYAVQQLTRYADQLYQIIDCTGIGTEVLSDTLNVPPIVSNSHVIADPSPVYAGFPAIAALTIRAVPNTVETIAPGYTVNASATTGLAEIVVAGASWGTDEHRGRKLLWNGSTISTIYANTSNTLFVCTDASFINNSQALVIVEESAELRLSTVGSMGATLQLVGTQCGVCLCGIKITRVAPTAGTNQALAFAQIEDFLAFGCMFQGVDMNGSVATTPLFSGVWIYEASTFDAFNVTGSGFTAVDTFWDGIHGHWSVQGAASPGVYCLTCVFDGCTEVGHGDSIAPAIGFYMEQVLIRNGLSNGVVYYGGTRCVLYLVEINDCGGGGIWVGGPGRLDAYAVTGTGNLFGIYVSSGGHVRVDDATVVTGASGDLLVGGLPMRTWTNYRNAVPVRHQADFFNVNFSDGSVVTG
jgi:hypothetical protein